MQQEAKTIIQSLGLQFQRAPFPLYQSKEYTLVVTGTGVQQCAAAVGWTFGAFPQAAGAVNMGCAGGSAAVTLGELYLAHAAYYGSSRPIFPDILCPHEFQEAPVFSADSAVTEQKMQTPALYDMEAYGFFAAALQFLPQDRVASLKLISDIPGQTALPNKNQVENLFHKANSNIISFIEQFALYCKKESPALPNFSSQAAQISKQLHLTTAQTNILQNALQNSYVYYGTQPELSTLPVPSGKGKREAAAAFHALLENLKQNQCSIPAPPVSMPAEEPFSFFQHIYITKDVLHHPDVPKILKQFPHSIPVEIPHYKSIFNRPRQSINRQSRQKNLILTTAQPALLYKGSNYCNAFGFSEFYYCSTVLGCPYDCDYCYLKGLYPTANIAAFLNTEDFFREIEKSCHGTPMLVCCSYDSDIVALDGILHTVPKWLDFARRHPEITLEIRTKCASLHPFQGAPCRNVIIAYTVCPASSQKEYEHGTSSVSSRIQSAKTLSRQGWRIRLCMEPIVTQCPIQEYQQLIQSIFCDCDKFEDIVIGTFRMNQQYYQTLRKLRPFCKMLCSPYMVTDGKMVQDTLAESYISQISSEIQKYTNIPIIVFDGQDKF